MALRIYLDFITSGHGIREIEEPQGADAVSFSIKQDDGRKGRDTQSAGDSGFKYRVTDKMNGCLDLLLLNWKLQSHQAKVKISIDYGDGIIVLGNVNMIDPDTDGKTFFEFTVIQDSIEAKFKETMETTVDLFSTVNLKGEPITPCAKYKIYMPAKPYTKESEWTNPSEIIISRYRPLGFQPLGPQGNTILPGFFNAIQNITKGDIDASLTNLVNETDTAGGNSVSDYNTPPQNFVFLRADSNLTGLTATLQLHLKSEWTNESPPATNMQIRGRIFKGVYGESFDDFKAANIANGITVYDTGVLNTSRRTYEYNGTIADIQLPDLNRGECLYFVFIHAAGTDIAVSKNTFYPSKFTIKGSEVAYNSIIDAVRYIDAIKYVTLSNSGLPVSAPRFEFGGEFYDQFITNAQLMRGLDRPFYVSMKDILDKQIRPELNGDYQINNGTVFFGLREDFYRSVNIGSFPVQQYDTWRLSINERTTCNAVNISFTNYASQKESTTGNTLDIVHGESENYIPNDMVADTRDITIGFIRDPFYIQDMLNKANETTDDTATQDDDKIVMLDVTQFSGTRERSETSQLIHTVARAGAIPIISLKNDNSFSWVTLGIFVGSIFKILNTTNAGNYVVTGVTRQDLTLQPIGDITGREFFDLLDANTRYTYIINTSIALKLRTDEGFTIISGLNDGDNFGNLRFTKQRILENYYNSELATILLDNPFPIKNTKYLYGKNAITQFGSEPIITEGETFYPAGAILTRFNFECELQMNIAEYFALQSAVKLSRGYIETLDQDGLIIQGYPKNMEWTGLIFGAETPQEFGGVMKGMFEEKYNQFQVVIIAEGNTRVINGTRYEDGFRYSLDGLGYITLKDYNSKRILPPVLYNRIRINDSGAAISAQEVSGWLNLYAVR